MRKFFNDLKIIMNALGIKFPPIIYLIYIGLCFILMMQESKRDIGTGFLIGGTVLMIVWSHFKHKKKE
jgi:hypothetical protein